MDKDQQNKQPEINEESSFKGALNTLSEVTKFTGIFILVLGGVILTVKMGKILVKDVKDIGL